MGWSTVFSDIVERYFLINRRWSVNDKNIEKSGVMEAPAAPARTSNAGDGAVGAGPIVGFSAQRKLAAVQRHAFRFATNSRSALES